MEINLIDLEINEMKLHITKLVFITAEDENNGHRILGNKSVVQSYYKEFDNEEDLKNEMSTKITELREQVNRFDWGVQNDDR